VLGGPPQGQARTPHGRAAAAPARGRWLAAAGRRTGADYVPRCGMSSTAARRLARHLRALGYRVRVQRYRAGAPGRFYYVVVHAYCTAAVGWQSAYEGSRRCDAQFVEAFKAALK